MSTTTPGPWREPEPGIQDRVSRLSRSEWLRLYQGLPTTDNQREETRMPTPYATQTTQVPDSRHQTAATLDSQTGPCQGPDCDKVGTWRAQNTQYHLDDPRDYGTEKDPNWGCYCPEHQKEVDESWAERWEEHWSSRW